MKFSDKDLVRQCWSSARANRDWPGKVTIRSYSNWRGWDIRGEGTTEADAWADAVKRIQDRIDSVSDDILMAFATTCSDKGLRLRAEMILRERHPSQIMKPERLTEPSRAGRENS